MADASVIHLGENSPEQVAFRLLTAVAYAEDMKITGVASGHKPADRKWILDTYVECINAVHGSR